MHLSEIRKAFLSYFKENNHKVLPSSSVVPQDDPTLLFTNAGMVQFKNYFTGLETPPSKRAVTSQKCIRAGGKHNDLDNVGYTARHHTFFEMLGNFSFGDYFKEEAIHYAWEFITRTLDISKDRLLVTVYSEDEEAYKLWKAMTNWGDDRIIKIPTSDNFWSMGDTGPCGPCSEVFFDHGEGIFGGPPGSKDEDGDRFTEIWNLVFMQYEQLETGDRIDLPKPSIDTGMGLERVAAVLQGVHNNYDIDLFARLIEGTAEILKLKPGEQNQASFRVIADHLRSSAFLLADGVTPSNDGRGYVLRRIMRRAMRHLYILGAKDGDFSRLYPLLETQMGEAYGELNRASSSIRRALAQEETRFRKTLGRGMTLLEEKTSKMSEGGELDGETLFKLYDTYGFPVDLTEDILRSQNMTADMAGFDKAMEKQKALASASWQGSGDAQDSTVWFDLSRQHKETEFLGYEHLASEEKLVAIVVNGAVQDKAVTVAKGQAASLLFTATPFYAESGGQAGDKGVITLNKGLVFRVEDTKKRANGLFEHQGFFETAGELKLQDQARLEVDSPRRDALKRNHSATHLLHAALRETLGEHVTQKGSLVEADKFRFDFSHDAPVSTDELQKIEGIVNRVILQNGEVRTDIMTPEAATKAGALALFGEKYGDEVRVLTMGEAESDVQSKTGTPYSVELCGGTHVGRLGDIGLFTITNETGVAAGVRRIEAMTGTEALNELAQFRQQLRHAGAILKTPTEAVTEKISALLEERKSLEDQVKDLKVKVARGGDKSGEASNASIGSLMGAKLSVSKLQGIDGKALRGLIDEEKKALGSGAVILVSEDNGKVAIAAGVTEDLTDKISAVDIIRHLTPHIGGKGGGGRADFAQGGGSDISGLAEGLEGLEGALS